MAMKHSFKATPSTSVERIRGHVVKSFCGSGRVGVSHGLVFLRCGILAKNLALRGSKTCLRRACEFHRRIALAQQISTKQRSAIAPSRE